MNPVALSRMRRAALVLCAAVALAAGAKAGSDEAVSADADASRPFLVKIHADWCGTCTRMNPTFEVLEKKVGSESRIVVLDVTDKATTAAARAEAERLGVTGFFDEYKSRTGTVGVLRGDSREVVQVIKGATDPARYVTALEQARSSS
jgi:thiol-disulfide isomerase/thioredoxin